MFFELLESEYVEYETKWHMAGYIMQSRYVHIKWQCPKSAIIPYRISVPLYGFCGLSNSCKDLIALPIPPLHVFLYGCYLLFVAKFLPPENSIFLS